MEWLKELFVEHSALQAVVVVSLISTIGIGLGKIRFFGISLGTAFIFFVGTLAGHFGLSLDPAMLTYADALAFGLGVPVSRDEALEKAEEAILAASDKTRSMKVVLTGPAL